MNRFVTGYKRMIKSKGVKIFCASLLCFCAGAVGTGFFVLSMNKIETPNGIGGLETNAVPEFTDEFAELTTDDIYSAESLIKDLDSEDSESSIASEDSLNTELSEKLVLLIDSSIGI